MDLCENQNWGCLDINCLFQRNLKSYSLQKTANLIGVSYNTVRKLIQEDKLKVNYINDKQEKGKCIVPAWSIKEYLSNKKQK